MTRNLESIQKEALIDRIENYERTMPREATATKEQVAMWMAIGATLATLATIATITSIALLAKATGA